MSRTVCFHPFPASVNIYKPRPRARLKCLFCSETPFWTTFMTLDTANSTLRTSSHPLVYRRVWAESDEKSRNGRIKPGINHPQKPSGINPKHGPWRLEASQNCSGINTEKRRSCTSGENQPTVKRVKRRPGYGPFSHRLDERRTEEQCPTVKRVRERKRTMRTMPPSLFTILWENEELSANSVPLSFNNQQ